MIPGIVKENFFDISSIGGLVDKNILMACYERKNTGEEPVCHVLKKQLSDLKENLRILKNKLDQLKAKLKGLRKSVAL